MKLYTSFCLSRIAQLALLCSVVVPVTSLANEKVLQFGLLPYTSPVRLVKVFSPLKAYLEAKLDREIELSTRPNYQEFVAGTKSGVYDIALTAPHFALLAERNFGYERLAKASGELGGVVLVQEDSTYKSIIDLRGKVIATPDKLALISLLGEQLFADNDMYWPGDIRFVEKNSHTSAGLATAFGETEASILYYPAYQKYTEANSIQGNLRVLTKTNRTSHVTFIANKKLPKQLLRKLKSALLAIPRDKPPGSKFFNSIGIDGIVEINGGDDLGLERYLKLLLGYLPEYSNG